MLDTDARRGGHLYRRWGWETVGVIPDFAPTADGELTSTTVMTKRLSGLPLRT